MRGELGIWRLVLWLLEHVPEWCADALMATHRTGRVTRGALAVLVAGGLSVVLYLRFGPAGALSLLLFAVMVFAAGREVFLARDGLWRASNLRLDDARQRPDPEAMAGIASASAQALHRLALATDAVRRGRNADAANLAAGIDRTRLRRSELALLEAVRAMVSLGLGDHDRAAQLAVLALPTGLPEIDEALGRAVLSQAWHDERRLSSVDRAWQKAGIELGGDGALPRMRRLTRLRFEPERRMRVAPVEARELADEARAIGDDDLALELSAAAHRSGTYR
jgi:hypothetical protein